MCNLSNGQESHPPSRTLHSLTCPYYPWENVSMDFIIGLPQTQRNKDSILVVEVAFQRWHTFSIVTSAMMPQCSQLVLQRDCQAPWHCKINCIQGRHQLFESFLVILCKKLGTKLKYSTTCHLQTDG